MAEELISITFDPRPLDAFKRGASGKGIVRAVAKATSKAGADAIRKTRVESSREIRARKKLRAGFVNKGLPTSRKGSMSRIDSLEWRMDVSGKGVPMKTYPARQTKKGVTVQVNAGKRKLVKGAFIARMKSGHVGVFMRMGKKRLPIEELYSSTLAHVFRDADVIPKVQGIAQSAFTSTFSRLLPAELDKILP